MQIQLEEAENCSPALVENRRFLIKIAENRREIEAAMRLRYQVFKIEQGRMPDFPASDWIAMNMMNIAGICWWSTVRRIG